MVAARSRSAGRARQEAKLILLAIPALLFLVVVLFVPLLKLLSQS